MKKQLLKNNGFTMIELLAVIVILALITGIAIASYSSYYAHAQSKVYKNYEEGMQEAAMTYIMETGDMPTSTTVLRLSLKYLVGEKDNGKQAKRPYIDYFKNPRDSNDKCIENGTQKSYVEVKLKPKQSTTDGKVDYNKTFEYKVCLICKEYKTEGC